MQIKYVVKNIYNVFLIFLDVNNLSVLVSLIISSRDWVRFLINGTLGLDVSNAKQISFTFMSIYATLYLRLQSILFTFQSHD